jgi:hypothetical protein
VGFEQISVKFTHQVADGMHGAIIKGVKTAEPKRKGLPVIQPATSVGCCYPEPTGRSVRRAEEQAA